MRRKIALALGRLYVLMSVSFSSIFTAAAPYTAANIGNAPEGSAVPVPGGYDVLSRSRDIGGSSDQFEFVYEARQGDFDIQTRVEGVTITDAFVHAGLMARQTLEPNSAFAAIFSSSALLGTFFESRTAPGSASQQISPPRTFPANYPQMFLRLKRTGTSLAGYASFDGNLWHQVGTATVNFGNEIFLGVAVSSLNPNATATARFREISDVSNPRTYTYSPEEAPGPSNRRTGLVFSEIMYNPAPRDDAGNLEFVEIFNAESVFIDLSGWRLTGGVEYLFPEGFRLESGQFAVIAADPAALERVYGYKGALGPFSGRLNNAGDSIRLLNVAGAVRLELEYQNGEPWPVAADGSGHSLVLKRPSYGEDDPRAWAASEMIGGSPGEVDARRPIPQQNLVINELLAHTDDPQVDFIELHNTSNESIDLAGCILTDDILTNRFVIGPDTSIPPRGFLAFTQNDLKFSLSAAGETVYLLSPGGDRVLDVVRFGGQENGVALGRSEGSTPRFCRLERPSPHAPNTPRRVEEVIINELMYHPITGDEADSYVELYNRSTNSVDLSGWRLSDGIEFEFPEGTKLNAGGYLVIAKDVARLTSNHPQLNTNNTLGGFSGNLSNSGERIALDKRDFTVTTNSLNAVITNVIFITVSEVTYVDRGHWPELADGGGSSLELVDPRSDTRLAANWAASDESAKASWGTAEVTARVELGSGAYAANRIQVLMQGAGECLVDDLELIPAGSTNIVANGGFELASPPWRFFGNHGRSAIESAAAFTGEKGLYVRAPGDGDTGNNAIRGNLVRNLPTSGTATLRAKVRWLSGWPEVLFRVRGNWIELPARMEVPKNLGTPGLVNSRHQANSGPAIYAVSHSPALPRASEPVVVTCRVSDPDGVVAPKLMFRQDPSQTLTTVTMRDDGSAGDAVANDGVYSATISGRTARTLIAFRISASDDSAQSASAVFPLEAPAKECLIMWDDAIPFGTFAHYHMWSTAATEAARSSNSDLDNTFRDATLVYGNARIIYNAGFRDKGSPYHNGGGDFALTVPGDEPLLGVDDRIFASTGNGGNESTNIKGDIAGWVAEKLGVPFLHSHYMRLYRNGSRYREVMYDMEQPNRYFARSWFGGGGIKDDLFKIAIWFEFEDNNSGFNPTGATLQRFISDGQYKLARYRWNWQLRPSTETANDYSSIFNLAAAANNANDRIRVLPYLADMEEWMRIFCYHRVTGNWDSYSYNVGQNMYLYAPLGQRAALLPWDIDFVLGDGDGPSASSMFTAPTDSVMQQLFGLALYRRMLWRGYQDAVAGPLVAANFQPQIDARRAALSKNGINAGSAASVTSYMNGRRTYLANQLRADSATFAITSNRGEDFTSNDSSVSLTGVAPFAVVSIEVNGVPFPITWTSVTNWQISVPLGTATNALTLTARDLRGEALTNAVDTISVLYSGSVPQPADWVVINEINYNSSAPNADFVEIYNRHPSFAFDLSGFRLSGIDFTFPNGTFVQPNGYLVIVENKAAFAAAYDPLLPVLGPYSGNLQRNGETLRIEKPGASAAETLVVDEVSYSNASPWPALADGLGPSLQLIDAAQDNSRVGNWSATAINDNNRATPGRQNATRSILDPFPRLWVNEVQPINLAGPRDTQNEREPWIEIYSNDRAILDLSGLYLSDDPAQPAKWQIPTGSQISPGQFLLVWADGETAENAGTELHTNFRLGETNGFVLLSRIQGGSPAVIDYLRFQISTPENSYGAFPDANSRQHRILFVPTPRAPNNGTIPNVNIAINEWMAASQAVLRDPADGQFEDWFELYNAGTNTVDLSGYFLSDTRSEPTQFEIPAGYRLAPGEFRVVWADGEPQQNGQGRELHVSFSLRADGEEIALFTPDQQLVTSVNFGPQTANISEGHYPDGSENALVLFSRPTPGEANAAQFANRPPTISPIENKTVDEGQALSFPVSASDPDQPAQALTFSLLNAPSGSTIAPQTGQFNWTPSEAQGPGTYTVTVRTSDNGVPVRTASVAFTVTVREVNLAPALVPLPPVSVNEGELLTFVLEGSDADIPAQVLTYSFPEGAPAGTTLDPETGEFHWIPDEQQGPGVYPITVQITDSGVPSLSTRQIISITVHDINNPPLIDEIPIQSVPEQTLFTLQVRGTDPETPPAKLTYELEQAPAGMRIDPDTGVILWTPTEADGPHDYNIVIRVSEPGGTPSATATFLLGVSEVNLPPTLAIIGDSVAKPGDSILFTLQAADSDLPEQTLSFSAVDSLPPGALLSPSTGAFSWNVPQDPPVGTNRITVRVTDDATPALSAERTFNIVVRAPVRVAINEIMHRPKTANAEFVELANYSAVTTVDLGGWRLEGYNYTFPVGTTLKPGEFLCVARNRSVFQATYGINGVIFGDASVTLPPNGGTVRLVKPGSPGFPDETIDEVAFSLETPWPAFAASEGASLQLIDPWEDHRRVHNWGASNSSATNVPARLVPMSADWKYWQNPDSPASTWTQPLYNDAAWPSGASLLYVENEGLPAPKQTPLELGQMSYLFRTRFNFTGNSSGAVLRLSTVIDDGAIFYLNGTEVFRLGMPSGAISRSTPSSRTVGNAVLEGPFELPASALVQGENVLAAQVHQINSGSTDIVLGAELEAVTLRTVSFTPNAPNSVARNLQTIASVWINEVVPNNTLFPDSAGQFDPWLELYNSSDAPVLLNGWSLTDDPANLGKWTFPDNTFIPARGFLIAWADADAGQVAAGQLHANFRLRPDSGIVLLAARQDGVPSVIDYATYSGLASNQSFGLQEDGNPLTRKILAAPTPSGSNNGGSGGAPKIAVILSIDGTVSLTWPSTSGRPYRIEATSSLEIPEWREVKTGISETPSTTHSEKAGPDRTRFFRVVLPY